MLILVYVVKLNEVDVFFGQLLGQQVVGCVGVGCYCIWAIYLVNVVWFVFYVYYIRYGSLYLVGYFVLCDLVLNFWVLCFFVVYVVEGFQFIQYFMMFGMFQFCWVIEVKYWVFCCLELYVLMQGM